MITILVLFHSNTFRNFKYYYLFYVCKHLKDEFPELLSYMRFVECMNRVAVSLLFFLKLALMGEYTGIFFIESTYIPVCENKREYSNRVFKGYASKCRSSMGTMDSNSICFVISVEDCSILYLLEPMLTTVAQRYSMIRKRTYSENCIPIMVIFSNHFLPPFSIEEYTLSGAFSST